MLYVDKPLEVDLGFDLATSRDPTPPYMTIVFKSNDTHTSHISGVIEPLCFFSPITLALGQTFQKFRRYSACN